MTKTYERATVKFNGGKGALLCSTCSKILAVGFDHEDRVHWCEDCHHPAYSLHCSKIMYPERVTTDSSPSTGLK